MQGKTRKATFALHDNVLAALDEAMVKKAAPSKNALVERALVKELKEIKRLERRRQWQEGAKDPALLKDISDIEVDFRTADAETARRIG
jgi:metal-responsive CopG/Arc/MetJ family transcriptional regulator